MLVAQEVTFGVFVKVCDFNKSIGTIIVIFRFDIGSIFPICLPKMDLEIEV